MNKKQIEILQEAYEAEYKARVEGKPYMALISGNNSNIRKLAELGCLKAEIRILKGDRRYPWPMEIKGHVITAHGKKTLSEGVKR